VPIAILLSIILPGNRVILFADLAIIPFVVALFAPLMKGNIFRMVIAGTLELLVGFYFATGLADIFTKTAIDSGFSVPENAVRVTSIGDGFLWPVWIFTRFSQWLGWFGLLIIAALLAVAMFFFLKSPRKWELIAGAPDEQAAE